MKLLILGGPKFLGRHLIEAALSRGHQVSVFNRGQTNPGLFPEVQRLRGNRDGDLRALEGRTWDAVIDTSGFTSGQVRASAGLLSNSVGHYTFVSTISVYRDFSQPGLDESGPLECLPDGALENEQDASTYGARKALCEQAAEAAMPGRVLSIRPGILVGPHDETGRLLHWVRRAGIDGEMLAPGPPSAPVQLIDVRDLAEWINQKIESGATGVFNATGPQEALTFQQMLDQCRTASGNKVQMTWVEEQFLLEHRVAPFSDLPFWLPARTHQGFFAIDSRRALASGLTFRPLAETISDVLTWDRADAGRGPLRLELKREQELLRLWKDR